MGVGGAEMTQNAVRYDEDFFAWTVEQARLLRAGEWSALDVANLAEEIESMGRSVRRELRSRLIVLLMHLLKWQNQTAARSRRWSLTIDEQRLQVESLLTESPSLRPLLAGLVADAYPIARLRAVAETGLAESEFPAACRFTVEQILSDSFLPEP
jgi:hypothetical protein